MAISRKAPKATAAALAPLPSDLVLKSAAAAAQAAEAPVAEFETNVRDALDKGVAESKAAFFKAKVSADEATAALQQSYAAAREGVIAINAKAFEALRVNTEANFDFMKSIMAVKSLTDLVALQSEFLRKQTDAITVQTKDIGALAQQTMTGAMEPIKGQVAKSFKIAV